MSKEVSEKHRKVAADIMDQACLPEALVKNGVDKCLRIDIAAALAKVERDTFKRAVSAAPDLLEALEGLLADIEDYQRINNLGGVNNHWQVIARLAIAKARGI